MEKPKSPAGDDFYSHSKQLFVSSENRIKHPNHSSQSKNSIAFDALEFSKQMSMGKGN